MDNEEVIEEQQAVDVVFLAQLDYRGEPEALAVFPGLQQRRRMMACFVHIGQHHVCNIPGLVQLSIMGCFEGAPLHTFKKLYDELVGPAYGYKLRVWTEAMIEVYKDNRQELILTCNKRDRLLELGMTPPEDVDDDMAVFKFTYKSNGRETIWLT